MKLSPDQKRDLVAARHALLERNEQIKEKRRRILADLQVATAPKTTLIITSPLPQSRTLFPCQTRRSAKN